MDLASTSSPSGTSIATPNLEVNATATDAAWETDFGALVQTLTDLIPKVPDHNQGVYAEPFENKTVVWKLNFKGIVNVKKGKEKLLEFDLEPFGIRYKFFSGKPIMVHFEPAAGTWDSWNTITPGSQVTIFAVLKVILFPTISPGDNPGRHVRIAFVSVTDVKIVHD
jgi:hypothetical protein